MSTLASPATTSRPVAPGVLAAISTSHVVNDMMQSLILAIYPVIKGGFNLSFTQIGLITLTYQLTASIFQPLIGMATDRRPAPYSLPIGMASTLCGMLLLGFAPNYAVVLMAAAMVGIGSAIFHPEASRIARLASGGRHGFAQSVFQVGGNFGTALGPLIAAAVIVPYGQRAASWFAGAALIGIALLTYVGRWYALHLGTPRPASTANSPPATSPTVGTSAKKIRSSRVDSANRRDVLGQNHNPTNEMWDFLDKTFQGFLKGITLADMAAAGQTGHNRLAAESITPSSNMTRFS